jgi:hypothetical protein
MIHESGRDRRQGIGVIPTQVSSDSFVVQGNLLVAYTIPGAMRAFKGFGDYSMI